jgi:hypothetical protein
VNRHLKLSIVFRYGSSSSEIWTNVFNSKIIQYTMGMCGHNNGHGSTSKLKKVVVFGSSVGLIVFYWALHFGSAVHCVGFEIMPILNSVATSMQRSHNIGKNMSAAKSPWYLSV